MALRPVLFRSLTSSLRISAAFSAALRRMNCPCSSFVMAPPPPGPAAVGASCCAPGGPCCRLSCATPPSTGCKADISVQATDASFTHRAMPIQKHTTLAVS